MNRVKISENVHLTVIPNEKFKRNRISFSLLMPNKKETSTMNAIVTGLLERAYQDYPDMKLLSRKLNVMYNASLSVSTAVLGENRLLRFTIQGIKNEYCLNNEDLLVELSELLLGVMFRPCIEDDGFISSWLEIEKYKLREEIEGEINDKRGYCIKNARRKFFGDSLNGVERLGYLEDIEGITPQKLYQAYQEILANASIELFVTANNVESVVENIKKAFANRNDECQKMLPIQVMPCTDVQSYTEHIDTTQGKVCLIYTTTRKLTEKERYSMLVASAIYGGTASSRLFKNVREKQSLCYYCAASFNWFTSSMTVDSGVEHQNIQKTIDAVQFELNQIIEKGITQEELLQTKMIINSGLISSYDGLNGLEAWYLNEILRGTNNTPEDVIEIVERVNEDDVKDVLKLLHLNVIYTITK